METGEYRQDGVKHATINGHRFHLRQTDPTEEDYLWIDGRQPPLLLDGTAGQFIGHLIDAMWLFQCGEGDESQEVSDYVVRRMFAKFGRRFARGDARVTKSRIRKDLDRIYGTLMSIASGSCPAEAGLAPYEIRYVNLAAPARMDLAITNRCNLKCEKCYNAGRPPVEELGQAMWSHILEILWKIGIPQVVFTGGEPTLRNDIIGLIRTAAKFVTGLVTNGTTLWKSGFAEKLAEASLDYVQITIESENPEIHDRMTGVAGSHGETVCGIKAALKAGLQVSTNTTLTASNADGFLDMLDWLDELGVKNVACNTLICTGRGAECRAKNGLPDAKLGNLLEIAKERADLLDLSFQWYSPTCYSQGVNPLELGFGIKACSAASHNMTIQPDGSVLPCQSWPGPVGYIHTNTWESIWNHPTCMALRKHMMKPQECSACRFVDTCAGGCPLDISARIAEKVEE